MWRLYAGLESGLAIKSTLESLQSSIVQPMPVTIGKVNYVSFGDGMPEENLLIGLYLRKRLSFAHEQEVRAITFAGPDSEQPDIGININVNLEDLVHEVVIAPFAPRWFADLVSSVMAQYNIELPIRRSEIDVEPRF